MWTNFHVSFSIPEAFSSLLSSFSFHNIHSFPSLTVKRQPNSWIDMGRAMDTGEVLWAKTVTYGADPPIKIEFCVLETYYERTCTWWVIMWWVGVKIWRLVAHPLHHSKNWTGTCPHLSKFYTLKLISCGNQQWWTVNFVMMEKTSFFAILSVSCSPVKFLCLDFMLVLIFYPSA